MIEQFKRDLPLIVEGRDPLLETGWLDVRTNASRETLPEEVDDDTRDG